MKSASKFCLVFVTAPDLRTARRLARGAVRQRLAACASLVPQVESHYWWKGKVESGAEVLMLFKTTRTRRAAFEKFILANHPYETPEFVVISLAGGAADYLAWIAGSVNQ